MRQLLVINGLMGIVEATTGWISSSAGLLADSLDMFADAAVYGIALYVVGRGLRSKVRAALVSGLVQLGLGGLVLADVIRRFAAGEQPLSAVMFVVSLLALIANTLCVALIDKHRHGDVHMRASWIFTANDALANLGVMAAGIAVHVTGSRYPDLLIGLVVAIMVIYGGVRIVADARGSFRTLSEAAAIADP